LTKGKIRLKITTPNPSKSLEKTEFVTYSVSLYAPLISIVAQILRTNFLGDLRLMKKGRDDEYISTSEAGKMLGISLSSVARYFDKGILTGEKNPITNWRYVSRESVLSLLKKYGMKVERSD
jgi:hypothetical protein